MSDFQAKCSMFDFGWVSAPDPAGGAYSAPSDPLAVFKGPTFRGWKRRKGKGRERDGETAGEGKEGRKEEREEGRKRGKVSPNSHFWLHH